MNAGMMGVVVPVEIVPLEHPFVTMIPACARSLASPNVVVASAGTMDVGVRAVFVPKYGHSVTQVVSAKGFASLNAVAVNVAMTVAMVPVATVLG